MALDGKKIVETAQEKTEDETQKTAGEKYGETKPEESNKNSDNAVASKPINKHPSADDVSAARDKKRSLSQVDKNVAGKDDRLEESNMKRAKITTTSRGPTSSAQSSKDAPQKKSIFSFTPATFEGPVIILTFGKIAKHEISIHKNLLSSNYYFSRKIETAIPGPDGQIRLSFLEHPKSAGEVLREYLYHSRLPWYGSDVAVLKGKEAATVSAKILAVYILADEASMPVLQYQILSLYKAFQPSEIDLETHMDKLDKAVGNPTDALRNVIQAKLDGVAPGSSPDLPSITQKGVMSWAHEKLKDLVRENVNNSVQEKMKATTREETKTIVQEKAKDTSLEEDKNSAKEQVKNVTQEEVKKIAQQQVKNGTEQPRNKGNDELCGTSSLVEAVQQETALLESDELEILRRQEEEPAKKPASAPNVVDEEGKNNTKPSRSKKNDEPSWMSAMHQQEKALRAVDVLEAIRKREEESVPKPASPTNVAKTKDDDLSKPGPSTADTTSTLDAAEKPACVPNVAETKVDEPSERVPPTADTKSTLNAAQSAAQRQLGLFPELKQQVTPLNAREEAARQRMLKDQQRKADFTKRMNLRSHGKSGKAPSSILPGLPKSAAASEVSKGIEGARPHESEPAEEPGRATESARAVPAVEAGVEKVPSEESVRDVPVVEVEKEKAPSEESAGAVPIVEAGDEKAPEE